MSSQQASSKFYSRQVGMSIPCIIAKCLHCNSVFSLYDRRDDGEFIDYVFRCDKCGDEHIVTSFSSVNKTI